MNVRAGTEADAAFAAALHASEISEGFLSSLGRPFLVRLYRRIVRAPGSFLLVADDGGHAVGFVAGTDDVRALYRSFLARDGIVAGVVALPRLVRSAGKVVETLRYPGGKGDGAAAAPADDLPAAELLAIAVAPEARGRGVGRALVHAFTEELTRRRVAAARVVVGATNERAIGLYRAAGFRPLTRIEVHRGTPSEVLRWP